ncbi:MAG: acetylxylan esterase [Treponema sp.]|nr:acetylxylan esterase [Treponema sp.]
MKNLMGNYTKMAEEIAASNRYPDSYLADEWDDICTWQRLVRGRVFNLLSYNPPRTPLNSRIIKSFEHDGVQTELVSWDQPWGPPTEAYFMKPVGSSGKKLPAVIALHDHSGYKYYGKEKITAVPDEQETLRELKHGTYEGSSWATELAKRGYAVLAHDLFLWGSRKMTVADIPEKFTKGLEGLKEGSSEYIRAYHAFCGEHENLIAKSLFMAGTTWPGVMLYEDMRAVDYLMTREEIDPERIGCGGLSGGGERTIFLTGMDPRIRCSVCAGFMTTFERTVQYNISHHTWMAHLPHLSRMMDLPDLVTLSGGNPLMVQFCQDDELFNINGMKEGNAKLQKIFGKMRLPQNYSGRFFPGGHRFDHGMQAEAFGWFDRWL